MARQPHESRAIAASGMKPAPFEYHAPEALDEALALLAQHGEDAKALAGGQSLVPVLNFRLARPAVLVDLNRITSLAGIAATAEGGLRIGAMTRQRDAERSALVAARAPLIAEAMPHIAHPQIRSRGTVGGSLAHADPAAELPALALALEFRFLLRRAEPAAAPVTHAAARDARTTQAAATATDRWVEARDFFTGLFATALQPDELLIAVDVPALPAGTGCAFEEVARRHGDYALIGIAAVLGLDAEGVCRQANIACVNAGPGPLRAPTAEAALVGRRVDANVIRQAADAVREDVQPSGDVHASAAYRRHLAAVLTRRAVTRASERARVAAST